MISAAESSERSLPAQHANVWIAQRAAGAKFQTVFALLIANGPDRTFVDAAAIGSSEPRPISPIKFLSCAPSLTI